MPTMATMPDTDRPLRVCSYEDRPEAMDSLILMGESFCRADPEVSLHLTVPNAPASVRTWAERRPEVILSTSPPDGVTGWDVKPWLLLEELSAGWQRVFWIDTDMIVTRAIRTLLEEFPRDSLILAEEWDQHEPVLVSHFWGLSSSAPDRAGQLLFRRRGSGAPAAPGTLARLDPGPAVP